MSADPFGEEDEEADADEKMRMDEENETDIDGGAMGTMVDDDDDDDNNDDFDEEEEGEEEDLMENPERDYQVMPHLDQYEGGDGARRRGGRIRPGKELEARLIAEEEMRERDQQEFFGGEEGGRESGWER